MFLVTIIIINWNGAPYLKQCLESLNRSSFQNFNLIVVDNNSSDNSIKIAEAVCPKAQILKLDANYGFARGNNIGFKEVNTPYTALLNNDTVVDEKWIYTLIKALEENPEAGFAASKMLLFQHPSLIDRAGDLYYRSGTAMLRGRGQISHYYSDREWVFGACAGAALYRTAMLMDIGLFEEDFFLLYEDVDLSFRAQLKDYKCLYVPEAVVYHYGSKSIGLDTPTSIYYSHRNMEWVYFLNMPNKLILKSFAFHLLYNLLAIAFFTRRGHLSTIVKAKLAAFKDIKKIIKKRRLRQAQKIVSDDYLWSLMKKENFLERIKRRMQ